VKFSLQRSDLRPHSLDHSPRVCISGNTHHAASSTRAFTLAAAAGLSATLCAILSQQPKIVHQSKSAGPRHREVCILLLLFTTIKCRVAKSNEDARCQSVKSVSQSVKSVRHRKQGLFQTEAPRLVLNATRRKVNLLGFRIVNYCRQAFSEHIFVHINQHQVDSVSRGLCCATACTRR
jgi:hypothetical protein